MKEDIKKKIIALFLLFRVSRVNKDIKKKLSRQFSFIDILKVSTEKINIYRTIFFLSLENLKCFRLRLISEAVVQIKKVFKYLYFWDQLCFLIPIFANIHIFHYVSQSQRQNVKIWINYHICLSPPDYATYI